SRPTATPAPFTPSSGGTIETTLEGLPGRVDDSREGIGAPTPRSAWVITKLERLDELLQRNPQRAKIEILKHLDGDLRPSTTGGRGEINGRAKSSTSPEGSEGCLPTGGCGGPQSSAGEPAP